MLRILSPCPLQLSARRDEPSAETHLVLSSPAEEPFFADRRAQARAQEQARERVPLLHQLRAPGAGRLGQRRVPRAVRSKVNRQLPMVVGGAQDVSCAEAWVSGRSLGAEVGTFCANLKNR